MFKPKAHLAETGLLESIRPGSSNKILNQSYNELDFQRARRALEEYCQRQNQPHSSAPLIVETSSPCLMLIKVDRRSNKFSPQFKCCFKEDGWLIFYPDRDGVWLAYPNLPVAEDYQQIIDELERAPLHVHWS